MVEIASSVDLFVVKRLDIGKKNAREWCAMCPGPESDQKTDTFPSFTKSFFGSPAGIHSVVLGERQNTGSASRKSYSWSY